MMEQNASFLWLTGWSVSEEMWRPYRERFPRAEHQTVSFNECGQMSEIVSTALAALEKFTHPTIVVGWSMGAMVALELAQLAPTQVKMVVAISATGRFVKQERQGVGWDERVLQRMKKQLQLSAEQVLTNFDERMFSESEQARGCVEEWKRVFRQEIPPIASLQAGLDYLQHFSLEGGVPRQKIYLLSGVEDTICSVAGAKQLANQLPDAQLTIWEGVGHVVWWTEAERFQQWLEEVVR